MITRLSIYGLIVSAVLAGLGLVYRAGYNSAEGKCNALALAAQLEAANLDLQAARRAAADAQKKATELDAAMVEANGRTESLEKELETREAQASLPAPQPEPRIITRTVRSECPAPAPAPKLRPGNRPSAPYRVNDDDVRRLR